MAQLIQPWETASAQGVINQYGSTGLGAWYLCMTMLPPHDGADAAAVKPTPLPFQTPPPPTKDAAATVKSRNEMQRFFVEKTRYVVRHRHDVMRSSRQHAYIAENAREVTR